MKPLIHEERLALIHRPFFITTFGPSYPWGGCAVTDNFFGTKAWAERPTPSDDHGMSQFTYGPLGLRLGDLNLMAWDFESE